MPTTTYPVDQIVVGWFMCPVSAERLLKDRRWVTCAAFVPCPIDWTTGTYTERPRIPAVEIDGVIQENALEAFHRIARWPITRELWMERRGYAY